jgi:Rieske 2Fe-2S family protein
MPSPRLGIPADEVDEQEILLAKVDDLIDNLPGYIGPSEAEALRAQARDLPDGMTAGEYYLNRRRTGAVGRGLDWSHLSDEQVLGGDDLLVFPNFIGPVVAGAFFGYRVRPNGTDPDTCIFDLWTLEEQPEDADPKPLPAREVYPDWREHEWGLIVEQDFRNFRGIQRGLRTPGGPGLRWNRRQESCVRRFHEVLDRYLFGAPT